jgi:hypothetical protein
VPPWRPVGQLNVSREAFVFHRVAFVIFMVAATPVLRQLCGRRDKPQAGGMGDADELQQQVNRDPTQLRRHAVD